VPAIYPANKTKQFMKLFINEIITPVRSLKPGFQIVTTEKQTKLLIHQSEQKEGLKHLYYILMNHRAIVLIDYI